jgi:ATP synthase F1 complex assembly factor 2
MPLMQLSSTALDHMSDYATFDFHVKKLLEFFDADQAVVAHPSGSELREIQLKTLKKVHDWARREFGEQLNLSSDSIFAQPQPEEVKLLMEKRLRSLSPWEMTCTFAAAAAAKSLLIGLALNRNIIDPEEALKCARVEEDYQIERHGFVEGGHDIDISDLRVRLTAPHALNLILKAKMGTM